MKKTIVLLFLTCLCVYEYITNDTPDQNPYLITDYSRLHPVKVERIVEGKEEEQLAQLLQDAKAKGLKLSISGQRHSQGGHTYYKDAIVIDMTSFNQILMLDPKRKLIRVQAGATWKDIQDRINPYHLSVSSMQSQNIFTVGGSISINAHGRDLRNGSLINSVESFHLLTADGLIREISRTKEPELFRLALGGYGLFGIILDVTLHLTDDEVYRTKIEAIQAKDYSHYLKEKVLADPDVRMHIARISVAPDSFLTDMYAINYQVDPSLDLEHNDKLKTHESGVLPSKLLFHLNRASDTGKNMFWNLQKKYFTYQEDAIISRNNAMRPESSFMEYHEAGANDLLQEYFVPVDEFASFVEDLKSVLKDAGDKVNLLNITVRYVPRNQDVVLSYAKEDMLALVCLFNTSLSKEGHAEMKQTVRNIVDQVLRHRGTYYLPYAAYPSVEQFREAYPGYNTFFKAKDQFDPDHIFMNYFYEQYKGE